MLLQRHSSTSFVVISIVFLSPNLSLPPMPPFFHRSTPRRLPWMQCRLSGMSRDLLFEFLRLDDQIRSCRPRVHSEYGLRRGPNCGSHPIGPFHLVECVGSGCGGHHPPNRTGEATLNSSTIFSPEDTTIKTMLIRQTWLV